MIWLLIPIGVLLLLVVIGLCLPTTYVVRRETQIAAPRDRVHALVSDLKAWSQWEPWREKDPTIQITSGEITDAVGATQSWTDKSGGGELTFTRVDPEFGVDYDLTMMQKYQCTASLSHQALGENATRVIWEMYGDTGIPVVGGYFARLMPRMIEPMFARGLEKLKAAAEGEESA